MYKIYDSEFKGYRDIREISDDLCTIDSTSVFDKRARLKYTLLPKAVRQENFWSRFWKKKTKANEGLILAAKEGNTKRLQKLLNKLREPEKLAEINYCDKGGYSAIHMAAKHNQYEAMRLLLLTGEVDIN